ncbi:amidohydrolase [Fodinisporobacter ferrooxydans]|uniref:Amidohydrolase n=1 Tax=Fodinisporobacter ferrooxydans TaxID=2901836 RepID=A0ABY4CLD2_9BACL|nr:amidohydrolase [Alicyclobacillaceae bacterium MYW30-H2]
MREIIAKEVEAVQQQIVNWRREIHRHPEIGWTEYQTTAKVADILEELGMHVQMGAEVIAPAARMGVPEEKILDAARKHARENGVSEARLEQMGNGLTGVVGTYDTGRPGPTIAFRFDMDALQVREAEHAGHIPAVQGFRSEYEGSMHACGHDGHTAIGLGLAMVLMKLRDSLTGTFKLIFQPAEEGCRGAKAMVEASVVDGVDYFFACHLGVTARNNRQIACGVTEFLASTKIDVELEGVPAHAALAPHEGRSALLAAATIALQLHGIPRHGEGISRINVGILEAGEGRNIVPAFARLQLETRGETNEINQFMTDEAIRIIRSAAQMYQVQEHIHIVGQGISATCDQELIDLVSAVASHWDSDLKVVPTLPFRASEDATYLMEAVQKQGGKATYLLIGTELAAGHHNFSFDFQEESLQTAVALFANVMYRLAGKNM